MDLAAAPIPWLLLGAVLGVLLAGSVALAATALRRSPRAPNGAQDPGQEPEPAPVAGWTEDDLPGFLDQPPGSSPDAAQADGAPDAVDAPLAVQSRADRPPPPALATVGTPDPARLLLVLTLAALLFLGAAALAALANTGAHGPASAASAAGTRPLPTSGPRPTWDVPDLAAVPERPRPGDPGAGRLAAVSVPIGPEGALARLSFDGLVLERRAVGITASYPGVSITAAEVPGGPALAHVRLPAWNCLTDAAPDDPVAAGCRRLPTEYAELPAPALAVTPDGDGLRITGRFPTYVKPAGSPPDWTGRVYPLTVRVAPRGDSATGTLHLGSERAEALADPLLSELRLGR